MIKKDLVGEIAFRLRGKFSLTHDQVKGVINEMEEVMMEELVKGEEVNLRGFGVFKQIQLKEKRSNLKHLKDKVIGARKAVRFYPGLKFKQKMRAV